MGRDAGFFGTWRPSCRLNDIGGLKGIHRAARTIAKIVEIDWIWQSRWGWVTQKILGSIGLD